MIVQVSVYHIRKSYGDLNQEFYLNDVDRWTLKLFFNTFIAFDDDQ